MALKGDDIALYLSGQPVPIKACNIIAVQPSIKQIVAFGESDFLLAANFLGKPESHIEKIKKGNPDLNNYTDYQIYVALMRQDGFLKESIDKFFILVFPDYEVNIEEDIEFKQEDKRVGMINPFNVEAFKEVIKNLFLVGSGGKDYNPVNGKAAELAKKFQKAHEKIQAMKSGPQESEKATLFGSYASILSIGMNMDINILYNYTPFQLQNAFNRYWKKVSSDLYQKVSTTPMMDVSKMEEPDDWSANIY